MCDRLAAHLADFSPRLSSNTRAIYSHCVIPEVQYPQLDKELFCGSFYLRHLCDEVKFPNWPIPQPVSCRSPIIQGAFYKCVLFLGWAAQRRFAGVEERSWEETACYVDRRCPKRTRAIGNWSCRGICHQKGILCQRSEVPPRQKSCRKSKLLKILFICVCLIWRFQEKFEAVNKAYEFLCSKDSKDHSGPNPDNIVLILRAQSILFSRYKIGLSF